MGFQWIVLGNIIQCSFSCHFDDSFSKQAKKKVFILGLWRAKYGGKKQKIIENSQIIHQVPTGSQQYRGTIKFIYFHILFISKFG
jgi:hypothetical protein